MHNKAIIAKEDGLEEYEVDQSKLLLYLGKDKDIQAIQLYDENITDWKLLKYHVCSQT